MKIKIFYPLFHFSLLETPLVLFCPILSPLYFFSPILPPLYRFGPVRFVVCTFSRPLNQNWVIFFTPCTKIKVCLPPFQNQFFNPPVPKWVFPPNPHCTFKWNSQPLSVLLKDLHYVQFWGHWVMILIPRRVFVRDFFEFGLNLFSIVQGGFIIVPG